MRVLSPRRLYIHNPTFSKVSHFNNLWLFVQLIRNSLFVLCLFLFPRCLILTDIIILLRSLVLYYRILHVLFRFLSRFFMGLLSCLSFFTLRTVFNTLTYYLFLLTSFYKIV